ncbi:uncharacterized protein LOC142322799 [Lycorma delicatula]|uniref:uncharacterized protein LOC142322799 n=1 Tax=Lycorma delicatula TaxID=130591 RepID=UPI003F5146A3
MSVKECKKGKSRQAKCAPGKVIAEMWPNDSSSSGDEPKAGVLGISTQVKVLVQDSVQVTGHGAYIVQIELCEIAIHRRLDVVLLQNTYVVSSELPVFSQKKFYFGSDSMSAVLCRRELDCVFIQQFSNDCHVVHVDVQNLHLRVVSSYFQYRDPADCQLEFKKMSNNADNSDVSQNKEYKKCEVVNKSSWKANIRKKEKCAGHEYVNQKGKTVLAKKQNEINIFLSDKNFLDFVKCGLFSDNQKVFNLSINLISLIDVVHTRSAVLPEVHIEMNAEDLNLMMRKDVHRALSGIKLFTIGIPSKGLKPLFCISMLSTENVRQIYYNLLNVALTVPDKNEHCYRCLRYILNKHKDNYNLAVLPWTSHLIDYVAKNTNLRLNDIDWLLFLKSWLTALQPAAGLWPTKGLFSYNILATTVEAVSVELIVASSRLNINEFVTIAKLILNLKTRLPNELKMVLKEIASE